MTVSANPECIYIPYIDMLAIVYEVWCPRVRRETLALAKRSHLPHQSEKLAKIREWSVVNPAILGCTRHCI